MPSPRRVSWAKFRVSAVSCAALVILGVLVYLLTGGTIFEEKASIYFYLPDATGLDVGSPVRVDGVDVGKVRSVGLSGSNVPNRVVRVVLSIDRSRLVTIPADSYAQLSAETVVGDQFVDVTSGRAAASIRPGAELTYKEDLSAMKSLDLAQFEKQLRDMDALLTDIEQGRGRVGEFIVGQDVYRKLVQRVSQIRAGLRDATSTTTAVGEALYTDKLYRRISDPLVDLDQKLARLQSGQGGLGSFLQDPAQYEQVLSSASDLRRGIDDFRANALLQSDAAYTAWVGTVTSLIRGVDGFNIDSMLGTSAAYDNWNGSAREFATTVREFRQDPRKFLRLKIF